MTFFLAWRLLKGALQEKQLAFMIKLCAAGIFIGTLALALVISIMQGFEKVTYQKIKGIHADCSIQATGKALNFNKIKEVIETEFKEEIAAISPSDTKQLFLENKAQESIGSLLVLKGIDPKSFNTISTLENSILNTQQTLDALLYKPNTLLLGSALAHNLGLKEGDTVTVWFTDTNKITSATLTFTKAQLTIKALFKTGIEEFDEQVGFCSLATLEQLFNEAEITEIGVSLTQNAHETSTLAHLRERLKLQVYSWKDFYPAIISALILEKYALAAILALIILVASMNSISVISMYTAHKKTTLALLYTLGLSSAQLAQIFITMMLFITIVASGSGLLLAFIIGLFLQRYPFIQLPDAYYASHLPIALHPLLFLGIFLSALLLTLLAAWWSISNIKKLSITQLLKTGF